MPSKILAQAGITLADIYNVQGSIAGVETLLSEEVQVVHEMGQTIFSERVSGAIRRRSTGDIAQNLTFDQLITDLPAGPFRILGISVTSDAVARVSTAAVLMRAPSNGREVALWAWSSVAGTSLRLRYDDDATVVTEDLLIPAVQPTLQPTLMIGVGQPQTVQDIAFRGSTLGFGAGTVEIKVLLYVAFSQVEGLGSRGLPVPSW